MCEQLLGPQFLGGSCQASCRMKVSNQAACLSSFELLGLRRVWVEVNCVDDAPIACRA